MPPRRRYRRAGKGKTKKFGQGQYKGEYRGSFSRFSAAPFYARGNQMVGFGLPAKTLSKHRYAEEFVMNPSAIAPVAYYVFSANGLYDPNITGTGHQPYAFDQLALIYNKYRVIASKIKVWCTSLASSATTNGYLTVTLTPDATTAASYSGTLQVIESNIRQGKIMMTGNQANTLPLQGSGNRMATTCRFSAKKYFGKVDDDQSGDTSTNPNEQAFYSVIFCSNYGNDPDQHQFMCTIDYTVEWSEPKLLALS